MAGLVSLLALLAPAAAISLNYTLGISTTAGLADDLVLCNSTFDAANATGIFSFTPDFNHDASFGAALALGQQQKTSSVGYGLQASLLFNPGTQDYYDNSKTGFDACTFAFNVVLLTSNTWLRGKNDNGSCLQTFDSACVNDLMTTASNMTSQVNQPATESAGALSDVCQQLLVKISGSVPDSCKVFTTPGTSMLAGQLGLTQSPGTDISALNKACTIKQNGSTWYNLNTQVAGFSDTAYDVGANIVWPIMTIFMPPADSKIKSSISAPETVLSCLHINHFNNGSRVATDYGTPTPVATGTSTAVPISGAISAGAIAGIVVGVLLLAAAAVGAWLLIRKRRRQHQLLEEPEAVEIYTEHPKMDRKYSEVEGHALTELSPDTAKSELHAFHTAELAGHLPHELDAGHQYHELPGSIPDPKIR